MLERSAVRCAIFVLRRIERGSLANAAVPQDDHGTQRDKSNPAGTRCGAHSDSPSMDEQAIRCVCNADLDAVRLSKASNAVK